MFPNRNCNKYLFKIKEDSFFFFVSDCSGFVTH